MLNYSFENQFKSQHLFLSFTVLLISSIFSSEVLSEEAKLNSKPLANCDVLLRVLTGSEQNKKLEGVKVKTGKYLEDVQLQLKSLPFRNYKVIGDEAQNVKLGSMSNFLVQDTKGLSHKLSVQPLSIGADMSKAEVGPPKKGTLSLNHTTVKLDWFGPNKESLLSSKLHIKNGQDIIIGTDASKELSTIFCVKVDCSES